MEQGQGMARTASLDARRSGDRRIMTPQRWKELDNLLDQALDLPASERAGFIAAVSARDPQTGRELAALLSAHDSKSFLEKSAVQIAAGELTADPSALIAGGAKIGPYRPLEMLGAGGMGE